MRGHIIVCGDDALAMRIIDELNDAELSVVPLHSPTGLQAAGVDRADAVIAASANDALNLEIALLARRANPRTRVVARIANPVLNEAMEDGHGAGAVLDVADLAAPSVVEALLERTAHSIEVAGTEFVVSGAPAPRDGTLREIFGRLAPVAVIRGERSARPGEMIACPPLDLPVREGDWTSMIGQAEDLAAQGFHPIRPGERAVRRRSLPGRIVDAFRAFNDDVNPTFYRALSVLALLLLASTMVLRFFYSDPRMGWVDAVYFSTETLATVGYGDFNFLNQPVWLRLWGVVLMLGGLATTAIVVAFLADVLVSRRLSEAASRQTVRHLRDHYVVVGLGSFGIRVAEMLKDAGHEVAVIERNKTNRYLSEAAQLDIPVIFGDATLRTTLDAARVERARAIAVLTEGDMVNIETGLVLRKILGPDQSPHGHRIPIVLRIYDRALGEAVSQRLGFNYVRSTVDLATPFFIGAAMGLEVLGTFSVGQASFMVGGVKVAPGSELDGIRMQDVSTLTRIIAVDRAGGRSKLHPHHDSELRAGDTAYLVGPYHELLETLRRGQRSATQTEYTRGVALEDQR